MSTNPTKILAIDDSKTMRLAIKITFAAEDADVTSVSKGSEAVARAKQMQADVVLVDASLADGEPSGYDVCQQLKADPATASTPVIILASNQAGIDQGKFKACGGDGWIAKPFDTQDLIDKVNEVAGKPAARPAAAAAAAAPVPRISAPPPSGVSARPAAAPVATPAPARPAPTPSQPMGRPSAAISTPKPAPRPAAAATAPAAKPAVKVAPAPSRPLAPGEIPIAIPIPFTSADAATPGMLKRLAEAGSAAGLDPKVAEALVAISREVIEQVVWEVVPELAEEIIKKQAQSA